MSRSFFVAARSSRHRTAVLALYRALVRAAGRIPLPQDVQTPGRRGPIVQLLRKRFAQNASDTSFRLIYAAMSTGYKFLSLMAKAATQDSPEHSQVVGHLRKLRHASQASRAAAPRKTPPPPRLPREPLLVNVAAPGDAPRYTSNILPRPASAGARRVPALCATADGQPFVRLSKPQPRALSRMVGRKGRVFSNRIIDIMETDEFCVPQAALEDQWDGLMEVLLRRESRGSSAAEVGNPEATFGWTVQLWRLWSSYKIETTWEDWVARGDALHRLVEEEKALLASETAGEEAVRPDAAPQRRSRPPKAARDGLPNVVQPQYSRLPIVASLRAAKISPPLSAKENLADPFISEAWAGLVRSEAPRMLKWMRKGDTINRSDQPPPDI